jgi:hypothetical protein
LLEIHYRQNLNVRRVKGRTERHCNEIQWEKPKSYAVSLVQLAQMTATTAK